MGANAFGDDFLLADCMFALSVLCFDGKFSANGLILIYFVFAVFRGHPLCVKHYENSYKH